MDKKYWEDQLKDLNFEELSEISKIVNKLKKAADTREEFINVLKRYAEKYPNVKYFCTGNAGKGAYECEGEWSVEQWNEVWDSSIRNLFNELKDLDKDDISEIDDNDISILQEYNSEEDWLNSCLNTYIRENKQFAKDVNNSLHKPHWSLDDADGLENGVTLYEFIEIKTGEKFYLSTSTY